MQEIFKDVVGYEGIYQISNLGNIKSIFRFVNVRRTNIIFKMPIKEKIIKTRKDKDGYVICTIYKNNIRKDYKVHRLVAEAFIPNLENKPQVNHINGIKDDNRLENLEWSSPSENINHSYKYGLNKFVGEKSSKSKLTLLQVKNILNDNRSIKELANYYCVSKRTISRIKKNITWKYV